MKKLKMHSPNLVDANIEKIAELFPNCVTESQDDQGKLRRSIDFDLLRQELSDHIVEGPQERYHLNWPGKREALLAANAPIAKTLRPCREESVDFDTTRNLFIEGDNLDALKLLQETYLGKVKMIYIDPPYNTGKDFIYCDDFSESTEVFLGRSLQLDEYGNRLVSNPDSNGRFHSDWLSMMYSRLKLARNLLTESGVIFISIDDWEVGNLRRICDEILGQKNFVGLFCRRTKSGGGSAAGTCAVEHDYVLAFAKNNEVAKPLLSQFDEAYLNRYKDVDEVGPYFWDTMERSSTQTRPYQIVAPDGSVLTGKWFRSEDTFKRDLLTGEVRFLKKENGWSVQFKQRLSDGKKLRTILELSDLADKKYRSLNQELEDIVGCSFGHPPKPVELLKTLVCSVTNGMEESPIVLDFFAGSGTTAHAVLQANAEDGGTRRFIMVQLPEVCEEESEAFGAGYSTIAEISKERIRRAGSIVKEQNATAAPNLDIGFRVIKINSSNMADVYYTPDALEQLDIEHYGENIKPDRTSEDLLFQVLLDWGIDLSLPIIREKISGNEVYFVDGNALATCFESNGKITEEFVKHLAERQPLRVVFRDSGFKDDNVKINVEQIFKLKSPHTDIRTI